VLADVTRKQEAHIKPMMKQLGAVKSITFKGVGDMGWDAYEVKYENGALMFRVAMAPSGKVGGLLMMANP
jgi:hypothetical protein